MTAEKTEISREGLENLRYAVVAQAVRDYRQLLRGKIKPISNCNIPEIVTSQSWRRFSGGSGLRLSVTWTESILYRRSDAKEHLSIMDKDFQLVERFLRGERDPPEDRGDGE